METQHHTQANRQFYMPGDLAVVQRHPKLAMKISQVLRVFRNVSREAIVMFTDRLAVEQELKKLK